MFLISVRNFKFMESNLNSWLQKLQKNVNFEKSGIYDFEGRMLKQRAFRPQNLSISLQSPGSMLGPNF